jgi:uncharacterized membrane protein YhhN
MINPVLTFPVLLSAILTIRAKYKGSRDQVYVFKPLTMILIIAIAGRSAGVVSGVYAYGILLGLVFSLAGDIFLMLPGDCFLPGLLSFLAAHIVYILAFTEVSGFGLTPGIWIPVLAAGAAMALLLLPWAGRMKTPVAVYMVVILAMAWQACERWLRIGGTGAIMAAVGSILFVFSDALLAWNRFRRPHRSAEAFKLTSYFLAQWLIASSVYR